MKKKLWKQWRFWLEVVLGLLLLFFMIATFGLTGEIKNMDKALKKYGISYDAEKQDIVYDSADEVKESSDEDEVDEIESDDSSDNTVDKVATPSSIEQPEKQFNPSDYKMVDFNDWNHDKIDKYSKIQVTGKVIQFLKGTSEISLRIAIDDDYDKVVLVSIDSSDYNDVIAEDDNITIYGENGGLTSYETTLKSEVTLPLLYGKKYTVNSYGN